ncbi:MAG: hypothetical protein ACYDAL_14165 [Candidatus Dormibacteraceae bacterium]
MCAGVTQQAIAEVEARMAPRPDSVETYLSALRELSRRKAKDWRDVGLGAEARAAELLVEAEALLTL